MKKVIATIRLPQSGEDAFIYYNGVGEEMTVISSFGEEELV